MTQCRDRVPLDVEPTDPVIQAGAEGRERRPRDAEERLDLLRRELDPERQTGAGRISKEILLEAIVREQPAERPFHMVLTHTVLPAAPRRSPSGPNGYCATPTAGWPHRRAW